MRKIWVNSQYVVLALTMLGQIAIGSNYYVGQGLWLVANLITFGRNFVLERPRADKVQGGFMLALTIVLMVSHAIM
jgi:hypothetical protein